MIKIDIKETKSSSIDKGKLKMGDVYEYEEAFYIITQIDHDTYMINLETGQPTYLIGRVFLKTIKSATLKIEKD